jgi:hypothetical protein
MFPLYCIRTVLKPYQVRFTFLKKVHERFTFCRIGTKMVSLSVPFVCSCWTPDRILVNAGADQDPIDIVPYLKDSTSDDRYSSLLSTKRYLSSLDGLEFPSSIYPPLWDQRSVLENAIIQAAATESTYLIHRRTRKRAGGQMISELVCNRGVTYTQHPKIATNSKGVCMTLTLNVKV